MRIVLVWASCSWSVRDVTTGLRGALLRAGHAVRDYRLDNRLMLAQHAIPEENWTQEGLSQIATESVLVEATYHHADVVLIVSGLQFHEIGLWLLDRYKIPTAVVFTESPYQDADQASWIKKYPNLAAFTQERTSAAKYGWNYLGAAYDPEVHRPVEPDPDEACDVLFVGTGFGERQRLLEGVDWTGINLKLRGLFPEMTDASPLRPFYHPGCIDNHELPAAYAACKIALNPYRYHAEAESLNPRAYELAACRVFQTSDRRAESVELFGDAVPAYSTTRDAAGELEDILHYYLAHPEEREEKAERARDLVHEQTFDLRVAEMVKVLESRTMRQEKTS
jgi:spore maturation protein CgeB